MKALRLMIAIWTCGALVLAGCGDDSSTETTGGGATTARQEQKTAQQGEESSSKGSATSQDTSKKPTVAAPSGPPPAELVENDLVEGLGPTAEVGDEVTIHYVGASYEDGKEFDASWGERPFTFRLGSGVLLPGGEQGVKGMKSGGRRELIIPPPLAYGKEGSPPLIGPNETLIFVVDMLAVK